MFKLQPKPTFEGTVRIPVPGAEAQAVRLVFTHKRKSELQALIDPEQAQGRTDLDLVSDIVCGWKDVDAEFTPDNLAALLDNYPGAAGAIMQAWGAQLAGAATKN